MSDHHCDTPLSGNFYNNRYENPGILAQIQGSELRETDGFADGNVTSNGNSPQIPPITFAKAVEHTMLELSSLSETLAPISAWIRRHVSTDRGASLVEYSLLIALIAVVVIASVTLFGGSVNSNFSQVASEVSG